MPNTVEFFGESFEVAEKIGQLAILRYAKTAKEQGRDGEAYMDSLAAQYDLLGQCIAEGDWARFEETADKNRADEDELMAVVSQVFQVIAKRPTSRSSDSSAGPSSTAPSSTADSSLRVIDRLETSGRPDLANMVRQTQESLAA